MASKRLARMCALAVVLAVAGCADYLPDVSGLVSGLSSPQVPPPVGAPPPPPISSLDPLSQFALASSVGAEGSVPVAGGAPERARVLRAYTAASGRQCREILFGNGIGERSQLVCGDANGFQMAPPLLRGSAASSYSGASFEPPLRRSFEPPPRGVAR